MCKIRQKCSFFFPKTSRFLFIFRQICLLVFRLKWKVHYTRLICFMFMLMLCNVYSSNYTQINVCRSLNLWKIIKTKCVTHDCSTSLHVTKSILKPSYDGGTKYMYYIDKMYETTRILMFAYRILSRNFCLTCSFNGKENCCLIVVWKNDEEHIS